MTLSLHALNLRCRTTNFALDVKGSPEIRDRMLELAAGEISRNRFKRTLLDRGMLLVNVEHIRIDDGTALREAVHCLRLHRKVLAINVRGALHTRAHTRLFDGKRVDRTIDRLRGLRGLDRMDG